MNPFELIDIFKNHVRSSFYDARDAHDCIFDEKCPIEIALAGSGLYHQYKEEAMENQGRKGSEGDAEGSIERRTEKGA